MPPTHSDAADRRTRTRHSPSPSDLARGTAESPVESTRSLTGKASSKLKTGFDTTFLWAWAKPVDFAASQDVPQSGGSTAGGIHAVEMSGSPVLSLRETEAFRNRIPLFAWSLSDVTRDAEVRGRRAFGNTCRRGRCHGGHARRAGHTTGEPLLEPRRRPRRHRGLDRGAPTEIGSARRSPGPSARRSARSWSRR